MQYVRVIDFPRLKVVSSGPITTMEEFDKFDRWWSAIDSKDYITPRDFMWYNEKENYMEWIFAVPKDCYDFGDYALTEFPGGLYAAVTSKDTDEDCKLAKQEISNWIDESKCFELSTPCNDKITRYTMSHIVTPRVFKKRMGYHLTDTFVPIIAK
jgi:hypothetical protein